MAKHFVLSEKRDKATSGISGMQTTTACNVGSMSVIEGDQITMSAEAGKPFSQLSLQQQAVITGQFGRNGKLTPTQLVN